MNPTADSQSRIPKSWLPSSLAGILLTAAFIYIWIIPLFRPRGDFLWGHYRMKDIYIGIPIALVILCVILILAVPIRYRRWLSLRLATVVISLLVVLAVCDAGYAFGVMGALHSDYWLDQAHISRRYSAADPELGFVRKPFVSWKGYVPDVNRIVEYRTDENGFRNPPGLHQADIVFLGDSYTEAASVAEEDTFVKRVAHETGLRVVNLGRGAYGPQQELIVLKRFGLAYKPRIVVWQLFEGNDLSDAEIFAEWLKDPQPPATSLKERYFNNSLLMSWLINTRAKRRGGPMVTIRFPNGTSSRAALRYRYEPGQPASNPSGMAETLSAIEAGYRLCQSQGIQLVVIMVPTMVRVMAPYITFDRMEDQRQYLSTASAVARENFGGKVGELCARIGCSFVDSFQAMRQAVSTDNRNPYIPNDEHLDVKGHEIMTRTIVDWSHEEAQ